MKGLNFKCEGNAITIKIYGDIGEKDFWDSLLEGEEENKDETVVHSLDELNKLLKDNQNAATIDIYINSNGGSVFDGVAMYNVLKRHKAYKKVYIDGFACSVASVIAMCGNQIIMPESSMMMIHNAWTVTMGNAKELRKCADDLDKINETIKNAYRSKMKIDSEKLDELMDSESFLTANECLEYGLCTKVENDTFNTQENVNAGLDKMETLYQNKLNTLNALKNCIKDIEQEVEPEEVEVETVEAEAIEPVEVIETDEGIDTEVQAQVQEIKENALKRFFNLTEEKE